MDAPCSATGVIRRQAGYFNWTAGDEHLWALATFRQILRCFVQTLRSAAILVYAHLLRYYCGKNTQVIEAFLALNGARELDIPL